MTPKQKANELVEKFCNMESHCDDAIECASITVDEIKEVVRELCDEEMLGVHMIYWEKVKQEIEKL